MSAAVALVSASATADSQPYERFASQTGVGQPHYHCKIKDSRARIQDSACLANGRPFFEANHDNPLNSSAWHGFGRSQSASATGDRGNHTLPRRMVLPVVEIRDVFEPYASYCRRYPGHCDLSGAGVLELNPDSIRSLELANSSVNLAINIGASDRDLYGHEDYWEYPSRGIGDCEDIALFKREHLVRLGIPRGAMTIALVHHRKELFPHAVLMIETTKGTYLLDNLENEVVLWYEAPYNFEARERAGGSWERYDQRIWKYE
ncbi:transglutaminase-like cysteine peptidase [Aliiruegeria haliotis]|nr:transglutaminase-like cysteine peptidase [Aliiruegeria haliotis]